MFVKSFMKIFSTVFKLWGVQKGHNSVKNVVGVTILVLCTSSDGSICLENVS